VIAADRGLDQAGAVAVAAARQRKERVARMVAGRRARWCEFALTSDSTADRITHQLAQLVLVHG
jgi:hypothetical protein